MEKTTTTKEIWLSQWFIVLNCGCFQGMLRSFLRSFFHSSSPLWSFFGAHQIHQAAHSSNKSSMWCLAEEDGKGATLPPIEDTCSPLFGKQEQQKYSNIGSSRIIEYLLPSPVSSVDLPRVGNKNNISILISLLCTVQYIPHPLTASIYTECVFDSPLNVVHLSLPLYVYLRHWTAAWRTIAVVDANARAKSQCALAGSLSAANLINGRFYRIMDWKDTPTATTTYRA